MMTDEELECIERAWKAEATPGAWAINNLLAEVKRLRAVAAASPLASEVRSMVDGALGHVGKLMKPLCWTSDMPTVDGEYFVRCAGQNGSEYMVQVSMSEPARVYYFGVECGDDLSVLAHEGYEWAGPVVCP